MKFASFDRVISPEVGACIAGYGVNQHSVCKADDLHAIGLLVDDGARRVLIVAFDLLGLDHWFSRGLREKCAALLGIPVECVLFTCTHTHSGPESRTQGKSVELLDKPYLDMLDATVCDAVANIGELRDCKVAYYSVQVDENRNRRYVAADNRASFLPWRKEMTRLADGIADKELGCLYLLDTETYDRPLFVIGNYAAHPLAGHAPGIGGLRISADFPGAFRDYIKAETGADAMFITGAAGDLVPKDDELGMDSVRRMGVNLAKAAIMGLVDAQRNPARFFLENPPVGGMSKMMTSRKRNKCRGCLTPEHDAGDTVDLELQAVAIGDVCFVGVPGELCNEYGLEIKWHSPFRKAFVAYCATAYLWYIGQTNLVVAGGYEGDCQIFTTRDSVRFLQTAVGAMSDLRDSLFPEDAAKDEPYPDFVVRPLVDIPKNGL